MSEIVPKLMERLIGPRGYQASKCVTGPEADKWRVEVRFVTYLTDDEFTELRNHKKA